MISISSKGVDSIVAFNDVCAVLLVSVFTKTSFHISDILWGDQGLAGLWHDRICNINETIVNVVALENFVDQFVAIITKKVATEIPLRQRGSSTQGGDQERIRGCSLLGYQRSDYNQESSNRNSTEAERIIKTRRRSRKNQRVFATRIPAQAPYRRVLLQECLSLPQPRLSHPL